MKSSTTQNLGYTGIVTLSLYNGKKKIPFTRIHNAGGNALFDFLANCLIGDFDTARLEWPEKIKLLYTEFDPDSHEISDIQSASGFYQCITRPERLFVETNNESSAVNFSFIVPRDIIENAKFNSIGLYPHMAAETDINNYSAICLLKNSTSIPMSSVLVIDWKLTITNR